MMMSRPRERAQSRPAAARLQTEPKAAQSKPNRRTLFRSCIILAVAEAALQHQTTPEDSRPSITHRTSGTTRAYAHGRDMDPHVQISI